MLLLYLIILLNLHAQYRLASAQFFLNNSEYLKSCQLFQKIIEEDPKAMFAYLGKMQADRFCSIEKYGHEFDKSELINQSETAVAFFTKQLESDPDNPDLNFCAALAIGFRLRALLGEKSSFYIIYHGLKALKYIRNCDTLTDNYPDVEFCKGLFEYYISHYPAIIKSFSNLLLSNTGNRDTGISRMDYAAGTQCFLKYDANYTLAFLYLFIENKPQKAISYVDFLVQQFPKNSGYHFLATFTYLQLNDLEKARQGFDAYEKSLHQPNLFFEEEFLKRRVFLTGMFALKNNNPEKAALNFREFVRDYDLELEHLLAIAWLELGKLAMNEGEQKKARECFNRVIDIDNRTYPVELAKKLK